ncbi:pilus assembly protein TadB, partial [Microbacterium lacticum]|nr:pilus assembly protein TadB [Microbacterium lacticum]
MSAKRVMDAADAAASVQRLAVLLEAGVTPPRAWQLLADSGDDAATAVSTAAAGRETGEVLAERGGAWGEVAVAWRVAETVGA